MLDPETGRVTTLFGTCRDVTERRRAEKEVRLNEERLRLAQRASERERLVITVDLLSYILKANEIRAGNVPLSLPISGTTGGTAASIAKNTEWTTYGADLASTRYAPLDQPTSPVGAPMLSTKATTSSTCRPVLRSA